METATAVRRLNIGCGPFSVPGWINVDRNAVPGVNVRSDLSRGLPFADETFDYAVAMHVLQDLAWPEIPTAVRELRRVMKAGGTLRIGVPDLDRAIDAYRRGDARYFYVPDGDARSLGAKLVTQIVWYGSVRTPFTFEYAAEMLEATGFRRVVRCAYGQTETRHSDIASLDNRHRETLFVEATR